jgi:AraC-like DNA-binding protein
MLKKVSFSSRQLASSLDDHARFALWRDIHNSQIASLDHGRNESLPFRADISAIGIGHLAIGEMSGTINSAVRSRSNISEDNGSGHCLFINTGAGPMGGEQRGRTFRIDPGAAVLISNSEPVRMSGGATNAWTSVVFPEGALTTNNFKIDDRVSVAAAAESTNLLRRYLGILSTDTTIGSSALLEHVSNTVVSLVQLAISSSVLSPLIWGGAMENSVSGLRAARLAAIEKLIAEKFSDPRISAQTAARMLGVSPRYVHDLLQSTGRSFSEWILEARLKRAMISLQDPALKEMRVSEIAFGCGFNDISYFNRTFRRRFGCEPSAVR